MSVIFKKLEKVGEPYSCNYYGDNRLIMMQEYNLFNLDDVTNEDKIPMYITDYKHKRIAIEIKQNKEYMEEKKIQHYDCFFDWKSSKSNLKPFDLKAAKAGKPVCTRDGRKARIICFDFRDVEEICCLIAAVDYGEAEKIYYYDSCGKYRGGDSSKYDLMMLPEKKEGWVNVYQGGKLDADCIYPTLENALENIFQPMKDNYIDTIKVEWEE